MTDRVCISSWIVLDDAATATAFPSVGTDSATASFQLVYWRCIVIYFLTSKIHNPTCDHVLFSNVDVAGMAPPQITEQLRSIGVRFEKLPITYRLPSGSVASWGNQFYVLDIIRRFAEGNLGDVLVLADSDCVWRGSADDFARRTVANGTLLYTLRPKDQKNYEVGKLVNGVSHQRMTDLARTVFNVSGPDLVQYHGGEFLSASTEYCRRILPQIDALWSVVVSEAMLADSIKEEAQFLSVIAYANHVEPFTANDVIRRIWTNFEDLNVEATDSNLTIWHLPAEKKFGFRRLFARMDRTAATMKTITPSALNALTGRYMGLPRRSVPKVLQDLTVKMRERLTALAS